jgi:presenilin-like A22 family membrane protease
MKKESLIFVEIMKSKLSPFLWGGLFMAMAVALTLYVASLEKVFVEQQGIPSPNYSLPPILIYFFGVVVAVALVLFFIPLRALKTVFRVLFTLTFAWGMFVVAYLALPGPAYFPLALAVIAGLAWMFWARIWLHDLLLVVTLAGAGSVFGFLVSPWTFVAFMLIIAVYDVLAVRFGFMVWMAGRLSESASLPAFIFPRQLGDWRRSLKSVSFSELKEQEIEEREHAVLGGGDIGFPLMLSVSVFFEAGLASAILVGGFALVGLLSAFLIQIYWLKGKPMPALPPIAFFSIIGFLLAPVFFG